MERPWLNKSHSHSTKKGKILQKNELIKKLNQNKINQNNLKKNKFHVKSSKIFQKKWFSLKIVKNLAIDPECSKMLEKFINLNSFFKEEVEKNIFKSPNKKRTKKGKAKYLYGDKSQNMSQEIQKF